MTLLDMARAYPEMSVTVRLADLKANDRLLEAQRLEQRFLGGKHAGSRLRGAYMIPNVFLLVFGEISAQKATVVNYFFHASDGAQIAAESSDHASRE